MNENRFKAAVKRFNPEEFQPFDKVLVQGIINCKSKAWTPCFFEELKIYSNGFRAVTIINCIGFIWQKCIPYNKETMHLANTSEDCPEFYKWWENQDVFSGKVTKK